MNERNRGAHENTLHPFHSTRMTLARTNALRLFIALLRPARTSPRKRRSLSYRSLGSAPDFTAARTAHPGSASCRQSRNRHCSASGSDINECSLDARIGIPQGKTAHARHLDNAASTRNRAIHFARNRACRADACPSPSRTAPVACTIASDQPVHQARFADAAFPQQHGDATFRNEGAHRPQRFGGLRQKLPKQACHGRFSQPNRAPEQARLRVPPNQASVSTQSNARTALMGQNELALKPAHIDAHQRLSHDNRIEIRRKHLPLHALGADSLRTKARLRSCTRSMMPLSWPSGAEQVDDIARCRAHVGAPSPKPLRASAAES